MKRVVACMKTTLLCVKRLCSPPRPCGGPLAHACACERASERAHTALLEQTPPIHISLSLHITLARSCARAVVETVGRAGHRAMGCGTFGCVVPR